MSNKGASVALFKYSEEKGYEMFLALEKGSDKWGVPGGNFDKSTDSSFYDCAQRSLKEKLGLNLFEIVQFNPPIMCKIKTLMTNWEIYIFELGQELNLSDIKNDVYEKAQFIALDDFENYKFYVEVKKIVETFSKSFDVETKKSSVLNNFLLRIKHSVEIFSEK